MEAQLAVTGTLVPVPGLLSSKDFNLERKYSNLTSTLDRKTYWHEERTRNHKSPHKRDCPVLEVT